MASLGSVLLLASLELTAGGAPRARVETDGSEAARLAADLLRRHVVLMAGTALPGQGDLPAVRIERTAEPGYEIRASAGGAVVAGADPVRAVHDVLRAWGCRLGGEEPAVPKRARLVLEERTWRPARALYIAFPGDAEVDCSLPLSGAAVHGLDAYAPGRFVALRRAGYAVRVASTSFDDFLPPTLFAEHPEWFAKRRSKRVARGNFALRDAAARAAYLDRAGAWLEAHPEVDVLGIWPEVTTVWDEDALALGAEEAYALLWREAAERFPDRRFEILATGLTLRPPQGRVPDNVEVRLRPEPDASRLQGLVGQPVEAIVRAWEVRGARVVLDVDPAPASWCGMPWPCHDAVRADARRFRAAVLRRPDPVLAAIWRDPAMAPAPDEATQALLRRVRDVSSWGDPRDAADVFPPEGYGAASRIAAVERLARIAFDEARPREERASAAADAYLGYVAVANALPPERATVYRRYRTRDFRRLMEDLLPDGVTHEVGPARVRETLDRVEVETDRLRLRIDRRTATVDGLQRRLADDWSPDLAGGDGVFFGVVAIREQVARSGGRVRVTSPATGRVRIELSGQLRPGGPRWESVLEFSNASGRIRQRARVEAAGGVAAGCRWKGPVFDRWVCPPYVAEGRLADEEPPHVSFRLVPGTLLYCRDGERGPGLAVRAPAGAAVTLSKGAEPMLVAATGGRELELDWIVFTTSGELGR